MPRPTFTPQGSDLMNRPSPRPQSALAAAKWPLAAVAAAILLAVAGCKSSGGPRGFSSTTQHGCVVTPYALEQAPVGSSKDQVLIALGSPSATANYGNDVYYYISQTRQRPVAFMPDKVVDQRIVAVYFDKKGMVDHVANYGLKEGRVFDFISRTTPT